jgi:putative ABC transport system ATP-binding protein
MSALRMEHVSKTYGRGRGAILALDRLSVAIPRDHFVAVMGPSGSGKSTFLHCAAGLDQPTTGTVYLGEQSLAGLDENALTELRRTRIGLVFQAYNLLPSLTVEKNVTLPLRLAGIRPEKAWLHDVLDRVGLAGQADRRPAELSGGQQQRAAIARALVTRPEVILADEPTGALDSRAAQEVLDLLRATRTQTVVMATHDPTAAANADTVIFLADGRIVDSMADPTRAGVAERLTDLAARP